MPFKSEAQRKWMHANKPEMAKEFEAATPKGKKLPKRVSKEDAEEVEESFIKRLDQVLGEGTPGATRGPTYGPEGVTLGSAESEYPDTPRKKKKKNKKIESDVLNSG